MSGVINQAATNYSFILADRYRVWPNTSFAQGKFGYMAKGVDLETNLPVAAKISRIRRKNHNPDPEAYYNNVKFREVAILTQVRNISHAIQILAHGDYPKLEGNKRYVVITEFKEAVDIKKFLDLPKTTNPKYSLEEVESLAKQLLECLRDAKHAKIIHGDLKPENLIFEKFKKELTVLDWGLGTESGSRETTTLQTPLYRAPEEMLGKTTHHESIDMWSFGCILMEVYMESCHIPECGDNQIMALIVAQLGVPPASFLDALPDSLTWFNANGSWGSYSPKWTPLKSVNWQEKLRVIATRRQDPPEKIEQLIDLISKTRCYQKRLTPQEALQHPFFGGSEEKGWYCVIQ